MAKKKKNLKSKKKAQANKKLITVVVAALILTVVLVGGFWFINVYSGAARNIKAGDVLMEEGSYKQARKMYGRAVIKEPSNMSHISKLQEATLAIVPVTPLEASTLYGDYIASLVHKARYSPNDADAQFALVYELHKAAMNTQGLQYWTQLQHVADTILDRLPEDHPRRYEAKIYRGLTFLKIEHSGMTDTFDDDGNIRFPGELDLLEGLESDPGNELAWSSLAHGRMSVYYKLISEDRTDQAEKNRVKAEQTMKEGLEAAGGSLEMSFVYSKESLLHRARVLTANRKKPGTYSQAAVDEANRIANQSIDALIASYDPAIHSDRTLAVVGLLSGSGNGGLEKGVDIYKQHLEMNEDDQTIRYFYANALKDLGRSEEAKVEAMIVLDAPQQPVGLGSTQQFYLRPEAANILFKLAIVDADKAETEEDQERKLSIARDWKARILDYVSGDSTNPMILEADGDLLMVQQDFREAATKYEDLISRYPLPQTEFMVYLKSARCLFISGAPGLAKERLTDVIDLQKNVSFDFYILMAKIEMSLSNNDAALTALANLPADLIANDQGLKDMLDTIALQKGNSETKFNDPMLTTLSSAEQLIVQGKADEALDLVRTKMESISEPDWRLYQAMALAYNTLDDKENAIIWIDKAIALNPNPKRLEELKILVLSDNRVDALIALIQNSDIPEEEKPVAIAAQLLNLSTTQAKQASRWRQMGEESAAIKSEELSDRAQAEGLKYQQIAEELGFETVDLVFIHLYTAIKDGNFELAHTLLEKAKTFDSDLLNLYQKEYQLYLAQVVAKKAAGENFEVEIQRMEKIVITMTEEYPYSAQSWRVLGSFHEFVGDTNEAHLAYEEAYRLAPGNIDNVMIHLLYLIKTNADSQRIMRVVRNARNAFPTDGQLEETWLGLELQHGDTSKVLAYRSKLFRILPNDQNNALQLALLLVTENPSRELFLNTDGIHRFSANDWSRLDSIQKDRALSDLKTTWTELVEEIVGKAQTQPPKDLRGTMALASVERERGRLDEASKVLDQYISQKLGTDEYITSIIAAANFLTGAGRISQAISVLESARDEQTEQMEISFAIGILFLQSETRDYDRAAKELELVAKVSGNQKAYSPWVRALVLANRFSEAEEALKGYEGTNIAYSKAMLTALIHRRKSEVLLAKGKTAEVKNELELYRASLTKAISVDVANPAPILELCASLIGEYALTQNEALLEEAIELIDRGSAFNESSEEYAIVRTRVLQSAGKLRRAIDGLDSFLAKKPNANPIRQKLIELHLDADDFEKAVAAALAGVENNPSSATWHQRLGDLYMQATDDRAAAAQSYLRALELEPSMRSVFMLDSITRTDQDLPYQDILKMTRGHLAKQHPIVQSIEAKALFGLGQKRDGKIAMQASWNSYQNAIEKGWLAATSALPWFANLSILFADNPEEGESFAMQLIGDNPTSNDRMGFANYWWELDREQIDRAISFLDQIINDPATDADLKLGAIMQKGAYLVEDGKYAEGEKQFREASEERADSPLILNNLSYVVGVYLNKPQEGLKIAMKAAELAPNHPSVIDTVSKLYELVGDSTKAAETLEFLVQIDPKNANALARLALLYAGKLKQPERGLVIAKRARSQKPRSPQALDALGWCYVQTGQPGKGESFLQRSIANGETTLAYLHMAQLVMNEGEYDEALGHLRVAEELSKDQHTLDRIHAVKDDIRKMQTAVGQ